MRLIDTLRGERLVMAVAGLVIAGDVRAETAGPPRQQQDAKQSGQTEGPGDDDADDPLTGDFTLTPRILLIVNTAYNTRALPGSFALFAVTPSLEGDQFIISANNTTLGFGVSGVSFRGFEITGGVDVNLKSPTPLSSANVLAPQFYNASIRVGSDRLMFRIGQFSDVVLPFVVTTTNGFPGTYLPGQLGFFRPQLRVGGRLLPLDDLQVRADVSLGRPLQTLQLSDELLGVQAGLPDVQGRVAVEAGALQEDKEVLWRRTYSIGIAGHVGRRGVVGLDEATLRGMEFDTWSIGADLSADLPTNTTLKARLWRGAVLGDYAAGIFQTVSTAQVTPVHSTGFLAAATQVLGGGWSAGAGFGRDDPKDDDLGTGERTLNQAAFVNVFWQWSKRIGFALEGGRWETTYKEQGTTRAWRGEILAIIRI